MLTFTLTKLEVASLHLNADTDPTETRQVERYVYPLAQLQSELSSTPLEEMHGTLPNYENGRNESDGGPGDEHESSHEKAGHEHDEEGGHGEEAEHGDVEYAEDEYEDFEGPPAWITGLLFAIM